MFVSVSVCLCVSVVSEKAFFFVPIKILFPYIIEKQNKNRKKTDNHFGFVNIFKNILDIYEETKKKKKSVKKI